MEETRVFIPSATHSSSEVVFPPPKDPVPEPPQKRKSVFFERSLSYESIFCTFKEMSLHSKLVRSKSEEKAISTIKDLPCSYESEYFRLIKTSN